MNACEALQLAQMNLRPGRGRSLDDLTRMALKKLRADRQRQMVTFYIDTEDGYRYAISGTLRDALWARCKLRLALGLNGEILDAFTLIRVA